MVDHDTVQLGGISMAETITIMDIIIGIGLPALAAVLVYFLKVIMKKNPEIMALIEGQDIHHKALNQILVKLELPPMDELKRQFENEANFVDVFATMITVLSKSFKGNPVLEEMKKLLDQMKG